MPTQQQRGYLRGDENASKVVSHATVERITRHEAHHEPERDEKVDRDSPRLVKVDEAVAPHSATGCGRTRPAGELRAQTGSRRRSTAPARPTPLARPVNHPDSRAKGFLEFLLVVGAFEHKCTSSPAHAPTRRKPFEEVVRGVAPRSVVPLRVSSHTRSRPRAGSSTDRRRSWSRGSMPISLSGRRTGGGRAWSRTGRPRIETWTRRPLFGAKRTRHPRS